MTILSDIDYVIQVHVIVIYFLTLSIQKEICGLYCSHKVSYTCNMLLRTLINNEIPLI